MRCQLSTSGLPTAEPSAFVVKLVALQHLQKCKQPGGSHDVYHGDAIAHSSLPQAPSSRVLFGAYMTTPSWAYNSALIPVSAQVSPQVVLHPEPIAHHAESILKG